MLVFDPRMRVRAGGGLAHEYLAPYHDPSDEPIADEKFDWSFNDADLPTDTWKIMMYGHTSLLSACIRYETALFENLANIRSVCGRYSEILDYHNVSNEDETQEIENGNQ